jgi:hypothetical protein
MKRFIVMFVVIWIAVGILAGSIYNYAFSVGDILSPQRPPADLYSEK